MTETILGKFGEIADEVARNAKLPVRVLALLRTETGQFYDIIVTGDVNDSGYLPTLQSVATLMQDKLTAADMCGIRGIKVVKPDSPLARRLIELHTRQESNRIVPQLIDDEVYEGFLTPWSATPNLAPAAAGSSGEHRGAC